MEFSALGPLRVVAEGEELALSPIPRRLLAALLLEHGSPVPADRLIFAVWGDAPPATARNTLQAHISGLRRRLPGVIESDGGSYRLALSGAQDAAATFEQLSARARAAFDRGAYEESAQRAGAALELWRGNPFPELDTPRAGAEAERLRALHDSTQLVLARALIASGRSAEAVGGLRSLVAQWPLHEPYWEQLMLAYYSAGRQTDALRTFNQVRDLLAEEMGLSPGSALLELEERILIRDPDLAPRRPPVPNNLPDPDDTFVGRIEELARLETELATRRLVTIVGGPGMGKTRLALETARKLVGRFPGGVWLARLVEAGRASDVSATIAAAARAPDNLEGLTELAAALAQRPSLLILDNCEHVVEAVREFLSAARGPMRVLATSRTALGAPGETILRLGPLGGAGAASASAGPVRLFLDRAAAFDPPDEPWDPRQLEEVCRRAGGIPLALELMASWVAAAGLSHAASRSLSPPAHERAGTTPHHGSLAEAISWTFDLLDPAGQSSFAAASVFAGSFGAEAFRAVCIPDLSDHEVVDQLVGLAESSLLDVEAGPNGIRRYRMLEPLREYAGQRQTLDPTIADRHADWYAHRAAQVATLARGPEEGTSFQEVDREIADFRQAMRHLQDDGRHDRVAAIATALQRYWFARYLGWEAEKWLAEALAGELGASRLATLLSAGWASYSVADYLRAESYYREARQLAVIQDDRVAEAQALYGLARIHLPRRFQDGEALLHRALRLFEQTGMPIEAAECRLWFGLRAANRGDSDGARRWLPEAIADLDSFGYRGLVSVGHRYLSLAAWHDAAEDEARTHLAAAEDHARATDDKRAIGGALIQRAMVEGRWGDPAVAAAALADAIEPLPAGADIDHCLILFGAFPMLLRFGRYAAAGRLLGHLDRVYEEYGWTQIDERIPYVVEIRSRLAAEDIEPRAPGVAPAELAQEILSVMQEVARQERQTQTLSVR
ncbi:MAG TPA: BTAD domain-containing putative transcriptional regulator [Acidimicrobiia bacterium]|nr:BTAD domain-containing putative transcriptional regulator [Acidimicrobiia bacterium]